MTLEVLIMDINDNAPVFKKYPNKIAVPDISTDNSIQEDLYDFVATDDDIDLNGMVRLEL